MNRSFRNKVLYACIIALLWFPLFYIGKPPSIDRQGNASGGTLAAMRRENGLAQAELGEIDPTSESMKLATLGMRGIAVSVLWMMANEYKKKEDFDNLSATINQITLLQPNFTKVWEFQAHNESFNVSVEYDDYKMRYAWVKKGIELLIRGTQANRHDTRLYSFLSWFFGNKIGRADEHEQFRRLFRDDKDFHDKLRVAMRGEIDSADMLGPDRKPDNWLVGRWWQMEAVNAVERGASIQGKSPLLFYNSAPLQRIYFAKAIEDEGWLGEAAKSAWKKAGDEWVAYGMRDIPTTWGHTLQLESLERQQEQLADLRRQLDEVVPGVRNQLREEKITRLSPAERLALETPEVARTNQQITLAMTALGKVTVTENEIADRADPAARREAKSLARQCVDQAEFVRRIDSYRMQTNYAYWRTRCLVEQSDAALAARQNMFDARKAYEDGRLERAGDQLGARELFESAWKNWAVIYKQYPDMMDDVEGETIVDAINFYRVRVLRALDINVLPEDFPLFELLRRQRRVPVDLKPFADPGEEQPTPTTGSD